MRETADLAFAILDQRHAKTPTDAPPDAGNITGYAGISVSLLWNNAFRCTGHVRLSPDSATSLNRAMDEAVTACLTDAPLIDASADVSVIITLLRNRKPASTDPVMLQSQMERGVHALELERNNKTAFMRESLPIEKNSSVTRTLERLCGLGKWDKNCYKLPEAKLFLLDTESFLANRRGDVARLERANPSLSTDDITQNLVTERLALAERWFNMTENAEGMLEYQYSPRRDKYSSDNNDIRQLATLWSMAELSRFRASGSLLPMVRRTIAHYLDHAVCDASDCHLLTPDDSKDPSIALNAFMLLTLITSPDYPEAAIWSKKLAETILRQQRENGSYKIFFNDKDDSGLDYYPGEAMLALMKYHMQSNNEDILRSVERAFPFYRTYWRDNKTTAFIPWHSQAYLLLYRETKDPEIPPFVFEMNDWLIANHQVSASPYPDLLGGFRRPTPGCSTSAYLEGLNDAYALAVETGDRLHEEKYRTAILSATRFLLTTQYTPENSYYLVNPARAIGGFRTSLTNSIQRIDHTQHAVRALMKLIDNGIVQ